MDLKLTFQIAIGVFSFKRGNMRFPNVRRVLIVLFMLPVFILLLVVNRIFLLLDYVLVPFFLFQKVSAPVFIVAGPRSGTTYLFHSMAAQTEQFTCFKLWEIILAPSIIQKYLCLVFIHLDRLLGSPAKWLIIKLENLLIGKLRAIHPIGLELPEEDEAVLLWNLSTIYLNFFYPDSTIFDDHFRFDEALSEKKRNRIMRTYRNYIRRHQFVFNRKEKKRFLSKNPLMMCKLESLQEVFPDAVILNINRCPGKTIPSTLALNEAIYRIFTSIPTHEELNQRTKRFLIEWYRMANSALKDKYDDRHIAIDFRELIQQSEDLQRKICGLLKIEPRLFLAPKENKQVKHKSDNRYKAMSGKEQEILLSEIPFMQPYCED